MKINILLMMMMMLSLRLPHLFVLIHLSTTEIGSDPLKHRSEPSSTQSQLAQSLKNLRMQGEACITRLEDAEDNFTIEGADDDDTQTIVSFKTTRISQTARQTLAAIIDVQFNEGVGTDPEKRSSPSLPDAIETSEQMIQASAVVADILGDTSRQHTQSPSGSSILEPENGSRLLGGIDYFLFGHFIVLTEPSMEQASAASQRTFPGHFNVPSVTDRVIRKLRNETIYKRNTAPNLVFVVFLTRYFLTKFLFYS